MLCLVSMQWRGRGAGAAVHTQWGHTHGAYIVGQPIEATLVRLRAWCGPWLGWWAVPWHHQ
jgi:hypothetical protein